MNGAGHTRGSLSSRKDMVAADASVESPRVETAGSGGVSAFICAGDDRSP
jgi:hypothetical protein